MSTPMAVWSNTLSLTASCLSALSGFESHPGHTSDLGLGGGFPRVLDQLQLDCHNLDAIWHKSDEKTKLQIFISFIVKRFIIHI